MAAPFLSKNTIVLFFWRTLPPELYYLHDCIISNDLSFERFIELPLMRNLMTGFFPDDSFLKLYFFAFRKLSRGIGRLSVFDSDCRSINQGCQGSADRKSTRLNSS